MGLKSFKLGVHFFKNSEHNPQYFLLFLLNFKIPPTQSILLSQISICKLVQETYNNSVLKWGAIMLYLNTNTAQQILTACSHTLWSSCQFLILSLSIQHIGHFKECIVGRLVSSPVCVFECLSEFL